jgi:hypothetical protein
MGKLHILYQTEYIRPTTLYLLLVLGWRLVAIFRCHTLQPVIHGFFIVYCGNLDQFDPLKLEYVAWQSKLSVGAADNTLFDELAGPFIEYPTVVNGGKLTKQEHLVALMDFGTATHFRCRNVVRWRRQ